MTLLAFDRSHFNAEPDFAAFKAGGGGLVLCKATEGAGWDDPTFPACRAGTEAAGLVFGSYHFARWGDPVAEARYYLSVACPRPGELLALDAEAAYPAGLDVVAWCATFCATVHAAVGAWPLLYMNQGWLAGHNWAPVAANDGLWLAKYDGVPTGGPTGPWPVMAMKQYTDRGTVPGEPGQVDVDAFEGDLAALLRYTVPATPTPGGFLMALTDAQQQAIYNALIAGDGAGPQNNFAWLYDQMTAQHTAAQQQVSALEAKVDGLNTAVAALAQQVAAAPAAACQGNPAAVLSAIGQKLAAPAAPSA